MEVEERVYLRSHDKPERWGRRKPDKHTTGSVKSNSLRVRKYAESITMWGLWNADTKDKVHTL